MLKPALVPLPADRWTPFEVNLAFEMDLTNAVMVMHIRNEPEDAGAAIVDLQTVTDGSQGIELITVDLTGETPTSLVRIRIDEATMEAMPEAADPVDDLVLAWDMHITPGVAQSVVPMVKQKYLYGPFTVRAGVTR